MIKAVCFYWSVKHKKNLDLIDVLFGPTCERPATQVEIDIRAFRCSSRTLLRLHSAKVTEDAVKNVGNALVLLDRATCFTNSGQELVLNSLHGFGENPPQPSQHNETKRSEPNAAEITSFLPYEKGTKLRLVTTVGADEQTMEFDLSYHLCMPLSNGSNAPTIDLTAKTKFLALDGQTLLIKSAAVPTLSKSDSASKTQYVVIVFRANIVDGKGHIFRDAIIKYPMESPTAQ